MAYCIDSFAVIVMGRSHASIEIPGTFPINQLPGGTYIILFYYVTGDDPPADAFDIVWTAENNQEFLMIPYPTAVITPNAPEGSGSEIRSGQVTGDIPEYPPGEASSITYTATLWIRQADDAQSHSTPSSSVPNVQTRTSQDEIVVTWDSPTDDDGNNVDVEIEISVTSGGNTGTRNYTTATGNSLTIDFAFLESILATVDVEEETTVEINVRPVGSSDVTHATLHWPSRTGPPILPNRLTATATPEGVLLTWEQATSYRNFIDHYEYRYATELNLFTENWMSTGRRTTSVNITGLSSATLHRFELRAVDGEGRYSNRASAEVTTL